ncbi:MAG: methyl-accepting chemotaxis protein [Spirochaetota bacterium]
MKILNRTDDNIIRNPIFQKMIIRNHNRSILAFIVLWAIGTLAALSILLGNMTNKTVTWTAVGIETAAVSLLLFFVWRASKKMGSHPASGYVVITGLTICLFIVQYILHGTDEIGLLHFFFLIISVFYFDVRLSIYALFLILVSQFTLFALQPSLIPSDSHTAPMIRIVIYLCVGTTAAFGAKATREVMKLAIENAETAEKNFLNVKLIAAKVHESVQVLGQESKKQQEVVIEVNEISQQQASSLEEVSAAIEELSGNSEAITVTAKSLFEEMQITTEAVEDLRKAFKKIVDSSHIIAVSIQTVFGGSQKSYESMTKASRQIAILSQRSQEMGSFISLINDIADKVNLLSLNAAIEAARAGDAGRGFAVVADEISKLADATTHNAKEIEKLIKENEALIEENKDLIDETAGTITSLNQSVQGINDEITQTTNYVQDVSTTISIVTNLNKKIYDSTHSIGISTSEQKIANDESARTIIHIADGALKLVEVIAVVNNASKVVDTIAKELEALASEMVS